MGHSVPILEALSQAGCLLETSSDRACLGRQPPVRPILAARQLPMNPTYRRELAIISGALVLFLLLVVRLYAGQWAVALQISPPGGRSSAGRTTVPVEAGRPQPVSVASARPTLAPSDEPPPRNTTDERGVTYDEYGVAIMGLIADSSGVHNVPPGRQVRIGGPEGDLFDVLAGGRIQPATKIREFPTP